MAIGNICTCTWVQAEARVRGRRGQGRGDPMDKHPDHHNIITIICDPTDKRPDCQNVIIIIICVAWWWWHQGETSWYQPCDDHDWLLVIMIKHLKDKFHQGADLCLVINNQTSQGKITQPAFPSKLPKHPELQTFWELSFMVMICMC